MVLLVLHAVLLLLPPVYRYLLPPERLPAQGNDSIWASFQQAVALSTHTSVTFHQSSEAPPSSMRGKRFYFDPNTLSASGWKSLGVSAGTISTIQKYLSKGGHFYKASDLEKIYGLPSTLTTQLIPFVRIQALSYNRLTFSKAPAPFKKQAPMVDVNEADSVAWETLPGIGPALSARIVKFRNQLGGFLDIQQIKEVYGLSDSVFESLQHRLVNGKGSIQRLHLNTIDQATLQKHPYIRYSMAKAIVRYREQHGPFARVEDIKKAFLMKDSVFEKLQPYLTTE